MSSIEKPAAPVPVTYAPLAAAIWMIGAILSIAAMAVAGREIIYAGFDTFELMTYRSIVTLLIVVGLLAYSQGGFAQIRTNRPGLHVARNVFHFAGQNLWFYGLAAIPMAQLVALEFTNPIWVALLAPLFLGERTTRLRLLGVAVGFAGILIVARPGYAPLHPGHLAGLLSAIGFAMNTILIRRMSGTESVMCVLFWMALSQSLMGLVLALPGGMNHASMAVAPWILITGISGLTAHYCLTAALYRAPATIVGPMEFGRLPIIALVGMSLYGEPIELSVFIGGAVILSGNLLNLHAERRIRRT